MSIFSFRKTNLMQIQTSNAAEVRLWHNLELYQLLAVLMQDESIVETTDEDGCEDFLDGVQLLPKSVGFLTFAILAMNAHKMYP